MSLLTGNCTFTSVKPCDLSNCTKSKIKKYFENSCDLNESLFTGLKDESTIFHSPDKLRLPLVFYYCHTAVTYVNKLLLVGLLKERVNVEFESLFEMGIDELSWDSTKHNRMGGTFQWPPLSEVVAYRKRVRDLVLQVIDETPLELPITMESPWWAVVMGMDHERIHLETSSVLIRQLPVELVQRPSGWKYGPTMCGTGAGSNTFIKVQASKITLGKPKDFPSFGWDNEYGHLECKVPSFKATKYLITNGEFFEFVQDNGYLEQKYWTEEGWTWLQKRGAKHPTFWVVCDEGELNSPNGTTGHERKYMYRAMFDVIDMPMDWPVDVNYHEAKAFCAWKGPDYRLPSEAEHMVMRGERKSVSEGTSSDIIYEDEIQANLNLQYGSSTPVNMFPPNKLGFYDVQGNVWEWVEDHFNGLPGMETHYIYDDYSTTSCDGMHNLILGGCWMSTGAYGGRFTRNTFRRHFFQHLGFRVVNDEESTKVPIKLVNTEVFIVGSGAKGNPVSLPKSVQNLKWEPSVNKQYIYDSEEWLNKMLYQEYGMKHPFPVWMVQACIEEARKFGVEMNRVLHLGTATGRATFELTKHFKEVVGTEFVGRFMDFALDLQKETRKDFTVQSEGARKKMKYEASIDKDVNLDRLMLKQLTWIPIEIGYFNCVLFSHIDRCMNPKAWLKRLGEITLGDGLVAIASGEGWSEEKLKPELQDCLECVGMKTFTNQEGSRTMTFWRHINN